MPIGIVVLMRLSTEDVMTEIDENEDLVGAVLNANALVSCGRDAFFLKTNVPFLQQHLR
jgi:hypothetical protein